MAKDKMKIAMLSVHSCPQGQLGGRDTGGMNVYIREMARSLGQLGHSVDVFTRAHDPRDDQMEEMAPNVRLIHIQAGKVSDMGKLVQYGHLPDFCRNLETFNREDGVNYDLIHSHYWLSGKVGNWLSQKWHLPHVVMFHTLGAVKNGLNIGQPETELRLRTEKDVIANADMIITATEKEKRDMARCYDANPEKINICPCGVNAELFQGTERQKARRQLGLEGEKIALFVGRIEPLKGIDNLLRAVAILKKENLRLLVIGGDEHSRRDMASLRRLAGELGIRESVSFLGSVPQSKLPFYYSAADVCVMPSYYETFGLVTLEALACGTPVVSTRVGVAESVIKDGETGYLVDENTPELLAAKIGMAVSEGVAADADDIRNAVLQYAWPDIASKMVSKYAALLEASVPVSF